MTQKSARGLFVVGSDTEVGKTFVTALIAGELHRRGVRVGVYKPVASGCVDHDAEDAVQLWNAAGRPGTLEDVAPQRFRKPLAPNVAAREEGKPVDPALLRTGLEAWSGSDFVLVEGVGGLLSPLSDSDLVSDLAVDFAFPLLIVVPNQLGCINHALLTTIAARANGLEVAGIVLNCWRPKSDPSCGTNLSEIERLADVPFVTQLPYGATTFDLTLLGAAEFRGSAPGG